MNFSNFNFAQPLWLWGLLSIPAVMFLKKHWRRYHVPRKLTKDIDKELLPHIVISTENKKTLSSGWLYVMMTILVFVALANPRWSFTEFNAYQPSASVVVLFDLSDPKYVAAGRQQIEDLANNSKGLKIGLVAYAGIAHTVTPITDDLQTLRNYLPALDNDLITRHGSNLNAALHLGAELLATEPGDNKSLLVVSGSVVNSQKITGLKQVHNNKYNLYILGLGEQNLASLQNFAKTSRGYYITADHSEKAINAILNKIQLQNTGKHEVSGKVVQWDDKYYWFLIPVALIFLYVFRFGLLFLFVFFFMSPEAEALDWFANRDQQAMQSFRKTDFLEAANKFTKSYNKAVALYRAGEYAAAETLFQENAFISGTYNMGNAQMQQHKWRQAISSYEKVLAEDATHVDAKFNLEIAKKMLADQESQQENQQDAEQESRDKQEQTESSKQTDQEQAQQDMQQERQDKQSAANGKEQQDPTSKDDLQSAPAEDESQNLQEQQEIQPPLSDQESITEDESEVDKPQQAALANSNDNPNNMDDIDLWLNRINSDIKYLLRNKFYIEGVLHE